MKGGLKGMMKKMIPGNVTRYKKAPGKKYGLVGKQKAGLMTKVNAPSYKVPKTPKQSGRNWK